MTPRRQPEAVRSAASAAQDGGRIAVASAPTRPEMPIPPPPSADEPRRRLPARATVEPFGLTADQSCDLLAIRPTTFFTLLREDETFPRPRYVASMPRWLREELEAWLRAQTEQRRILK